MFIQTEATPNPATLKFLPGRIVVPDGTFEARTAADAERSPLAERLFAVPGVTGVFLGSDFVTVTKRDGEWQHLKPAILGAIMELLETRGRTAVAGDGGDITFRGFKDGVVYLNMKGSCAGCPSSTATLKHGIQNLLRHFLPDVREVEAV